MNHFSKATLRSLGRQGIALIGLQAIPEFPGDRYFQGTAYVLNDNGTGRVVTFRQVLALAKAGA